MPPARRVPARNADFPAGIDIRIEGAASSDAARLIASLDLDLARRYPGEPTNGIDAAGFETGGGVFVVARRAGEPVACGCFRPFEGRAEIKRMFVVPAARGLGLSRRVLDFLEAEAAARGFTEAILETGTAQPEAIGLYRSAGWEPCEPFGPYVGDPLSVFFRKSLVRRTLPAVPTPRPA